MTDFSSMTTYAYGADGNKAHEALPNGVVTDYTYDTLNRLTDVIEKHGSTMLYSEHFVLNDDGTRASLHQTQLQGDNVTVVTTDTAWTYEDDGRLTSESFTSSAVNENYSNTFGYDLAGNRKTLSHTGPGGGPSDNVTYNYDARNELTNQVSDLNGETDFTYDSNGSELSSSDGRSFTYDVRNKIVNVTAGGQTSTYLYDDAGNRVGGREINPGRGPRRAGEGRHRIRRCVRAVGRRRRRR